MEKQKTDWLAAMKCGSCHYTIRLVSIKMEADGSFQLSGLPERCSAPTCQAAFGPDTNYSLDVSLYRRQAPVHGTNLVNADGTLAEGVTLTTDHPEMKDMSAFFHRLHLYRNRER
jgi:hypothetical protein